MRGFGRLAIPLAVALAVHGIFLLALFADPAAPPAPPHAVALMLAPPAVSLAPSVAAEPAAPAAAAFDTVLAAEPATPTASPVAQPDPAPDAHSGSAGTLPVAAPAAVAAAIDGPVQTAIPAPPEVFDTVAVQIAASAPDSAVAAAGAPILVEIAAGLSPEPPRPPPEVAAAAASDGNPAIAPEAAASAPPAPGVQPDAAIPVAPATPAEIAAVAPERAPTVVAERARPRIVPRAAETPRAPASEDPDAEAEPEHEHELPDWQPPPPPRPMPVPRPAAPPPRPSPAAGIGYRQMLAAWFESHKRYPEAARQRREEGIGVVRIRVDRSGRVLDHALVRSAGYPDLDVGIEQMIAGAALPPFPAGMAESEIDIAVNIRFSLGFL